MISESLAHFVDGLRIEALPSEVLARARFLLLDAVGIAYASTTYEFAHRTLTALSELGSGDSAVIGFEQKLALRDAVLMNGVLVHGLDFDDTHLVGVIHATSSCFPCALGLAAHHGHSGRDLLVSYVAGMEVAGRVGAVAKGELSPLGFHPTGVVAAFAASLIAGRLYGLTVQQLVMAQGIVLSMAAGNREYSTDAAWSKRLHPGWAGSAGITAAALAKRGFVGPRAAYEGRFGLYATHMGKTVGNADLSLATSGLGIQWELMGVAVKPFPACQFNIACIDAAIAIGKKHQINPQNVARIRALVPQKGVVVVCEPVNVRKRPTSGYAAQFSIQYAVACALLRKKFGLAELECYRDPEILALADKVDYEVDPSSDFPKHFSGEVIITMKDGTEFRQREQVSLGAAERPVSDQQIIDKFMDNTALAISKARATTIMDMVLHIDEIDDTKTISDALR